MNEYFAQTLASVLEETSTNMGNAMVLNHIAEKGSVTLEESEFYHNLCADIITEAAEDFIPDTIEVPDAPEEMAPEAPIELFDAVGNKYVFQDGQLIPVDVDQDDDGMVDAEEDHGELPVDAPMAEEPQPIAESEEAEGEVYEESEKSKEGEESEEGAIVEESIVIAEESEILEESENVVARILANLK